MNYYEFKRLRGFLAGETMDEKPCNCGEDHGSKDKNIAPSVVEGDEEANVDVSSESKAEDKRVGITEYGKVTTPGVPANDADLDLTPLATNGWKNPREAHLLSKRYLDSVGKSERKE